MNVAMNAIQAMPTGGRLVVEAVPRAVASGETGVAVSFSDTGGGIGTADLDRIFEPYFSTREAGVGLGLAITQRIVQDHGGDIKVESAPGKGTTFRIEMPSRGPEGTAASRNAA